MGYVGAMRTGKRHIESFLKLNVSFFSSPSLSSLSCLYTATTAQYIFFHLRTSVYLLSLANKCITAGQSVNCLIITVGQSVNCLSLDW